MANGIGVHIYASVKLASDCIVFHAGAAWCIVVGVPEIRCGVVSSSVSEHRPPHIAVFARRPDAAVRDGAVGGDIIPALLVQGSSVQKGCVRWK